MGRQPKSENNGTMCGSPCRVKNLNGIHQGAGAGLRIAVSGLVLPLQEEASWCCKSSHTAQQGDGKPWEAKWVQHSNMFGQHLNHLCKCCLSQDN